MLPLTFISYYDKFTPNIYYIILKRFNSGVYALHVVGVRPQVTCSLEEKGHKLP